MLYLVNVEAFTVVLVLKVVLLRIRCAGIDNLSNRCVTCDVLMGRQEERRQWETGNENEGEICDGPT